MYMYIYIHKQKHVHIYIYIQYVTKHWNYVANTGIQTIYSQIN